MVNSGVASMTAARGGQAFWLRNLPFARLRLTIVFFFLCFSSANSFPRLFSCNFPQRDDTPLDFGTELGQDGREAGVRGHACFAKRECRDDSLGATRCTAKVLPGFRHPLDVPIVGAGLADVTRNFSFLFGGLSAAFIADQSDGLLALPANCIRQWCVFLVFRCVFLVKWCVRTSTL